MIRLLRYDLVCGFAANIKKIVMFVIVMILYNVIAYHEIMAFCKGTGIKPGMLDYFCYVLGGPKYIPENMLDIYEIPVMWLMVQIMIAYIIGYYAITDLHRYGQHILLRSESRIKWWISKIIWNVITVLSMYAIVFLMTFITGYISGAECKGKLTEEICVGVCKLSSVTQNEKLLYIELFIMPVIISVSISILQMTVALITYPIIGFVVSQSITFLSTIYTTKILLSNYAMLSHSRYTCFSNIVYSDGLIYGFIVMIISIFVGSIYFNHVDILPKNKDI